MRIRGVHIQVPEREYLLMKSIAARNSISLQVLLRSAFAYYIKVSQEGEGKKRPD